MTTYDCDLRRVVSEPSVSLRSMDGNTLVIIVSTGSSTVAAPPTRLFIVAETVTIPLR
uniref:Uncharacterized protein n=1 Tax=Tetranychus urticae TaxID=32264 RepID=A0A158P4M6_TETUR